MENKTITRGDINFHLIDCIEFMKSKPDNYYDLAIVDLKIGIEIEGGVWSCGAHTRGKGFIEDMEKYNAAVTFGWVILRFTPQDLNKITTFETIKKVVELKKD